MPKQFKQLMAEHTEPNIELETLRQQIRSVVSTLPDVVWSVEVPSRHVCFVSPAAATTFGRTPNEIYAMGFVWGDLIHPDDKARVLAEWDEAAQGGIFESDYRALTLSGEIRWIHSRGHTATDASGKVVRMDGISRDITERRDQERKIAHLSRLHAVLSKINSTIVRVRDRHDLLHDACRIAVEQGGFGMVWIGMVDYDRGLVRAVAHHGFEMEAPDEYVVSLDAHGASPSNLIALTVAEKKPFFVNDIAVNPPKNPFRELALRHEYRSGITLPLVVKDVCVGVMLMYAKEPDFFNENELGLMNELAGDISFALEHIAKDEQLTYLTHYDPLTGLPNRALFQERITLLLDAARKSNMRVAVLVGDIRRFRLINETFGRQVGDRLLHDVAQRIKAVWPEVESLARVSADCFAGALVDVCDPENLPYLIDKSVTAIHKELFLIDGKEVRITPALGVAIFPDDGEDVDTLFRNAEAAVKKAKATAERFFFYRPEINARVAQTLLLEQKLRKAIEQEQFLLHYQPKIHAINGSIAGFEALLRWQSPDSGLVPPGEFIPILENTGLILEVGPWAIRKALTDGKNWRLPDGTALRIAVNVSPIQLQQRDFVKLVQRAVEELGGKGCGLDLEITESLIMDDIEENMKKLAAIGEMGVKIAIDDFGTGYSSLGYLAKLPVHALKIDRSFVDTMTTSSHSMTIVSTIISLAHAIGLKVIAEGVETREQAKFLQLLKCDELQGYLYSVPIPSDAVEEFLSKPALSRMV
ncbi:MAG: EAL domain-containing protein [Rugosibacter sp.]|nr:MAG: EAL domain-containing protein [Rugosibacter sp.]